MKLLPFLLLLLSPLPASAITWNQFWRPFNDGHYYYQRPYSYNRSLCNRTIYREKYIPATYYQPGYIRRWTEVKTVPCGH
jgi:hypothetical protein